MTYVYLCNKDQVEFEASQRITDEPLETCPQCNECTPKRLISSESGGFRLVSGESGGWAETGYAKSPAVRAAEKKLGRKVTPRAS